MGLGQHFLTVDTKEGSSEMRDCGRLRAVLQGVGFDDELICPKPRRMDSAACFTPNLSKPVLQTCSLPTLSAEYEAGYEILEIFLSKSAYAESSNSDCSFPYFNGSPPNRASNPLIHDILFVHQRLPTSPAVLVQPKPLNRSTFRASPSVRIEGFDCSGRESRCSVPALA